MNIFQMMQNQTAPEHSRPYRPELQNSGLGPAGPVDPLAQRPFRGNPEATRVQDPMNIFQMLMEIANTDAASVFGREQEALRGLEAEANYMPLSIHDIAGAREYLERSRQGQPLVDQIGFLEEPLGGYSQEIPTATLPGHTQPPRVAPLQAGVQFPAVPAVSQMPDFHNMPAPQAAFAPPAGPQITMPPSTMAPSVPPIMPEEARIMIGEPPVLPQPQGGSSQNMVPFRPLNPNLTAGPSPTGDLLPTPGRNVASGFPSEFTPVFQEPSVRIGQVPAAAPSMAQPQPSLPQPRTQSGPSPSVPAPGRLAGAPGNPPSTPAGRRRSVAEENQITEALNRQELEKFLQMPNAPTPMQTSPRDPTPPEFRASPAPPPPEVPVPPTAAPSGEGISQPKMNEMAPHLKEQLLQAAFELSRSQRPRVGP